MYKLRVFETFISIQVLLKAFNSLFAPKLLFIEVFGVSVQLYLDLLSPLQEYCVLGCLSTVTHQVTVLSLVGFTEDFSQFDTDSTGPQFKLGLKPTTVSFPEEARGAGEVN